MALRLYYVKLIHDKRPETCPRFFQVDLGRPILKFVWRQEGEYRALAPLS